MGVKNVISIGIFIMTNRPQFPVFLPHPICPSIFCCRADLSQQFFENQDIFITLARTGLVL